VIPPPVTGLAVLAYLGHSPRDYAVLSPFFFGGNPKEKAAGNASVTCTENLHGIVMRFVPNSAVT
jgi:hypothetical protein